MFNFELLLGGVLVIHAAQRVTRWMHGRGWIQWKMRGTSSALGNAVLGVQVFYQPQVREVLEARLDEQDEADESGDPPEPGIKK
ncbi:MAG TPA: hypothetical protein VG106_11595 [Vicinamibacterales bacterium]|nr:hypothetical protein [Vicinamibacterales bacterium]